MKDSSLDEILDRIFAYGVDWTEYKDKSEYDYDTSMFAAKIKAQHKEALKQELQTYITKREREARVDELQGFVEKFAKYTEDYDIYPDIEKRLEELNTSEGGE